MSTYKRKIYFIIGPTASGKTALSIELAKKLKNAEVVSADSRQIYKDLNISTGKVTKEEMEDIPHHMLDVVEPGQYFSVVDYTNLALEKIEEIYERGNIPIIVGGTGFYIDSLLYEYNLPEVKKDIELRKELDTKTQEELFEMLKVLDTEFSKKIEDNFETRNNKHRMMRIIEVVKQLGYFPELNKQERFSKDKYDVEIIKTEVERKILRSKIQQRTLQRLKDGMLEEIKLVKKKYHLSDEYVKSLGFEFSLAIDLFNNKIYEEEYIKKFVILEGQYAKRQDSWFKRY